MRNGYAYGYAMGMQFEKQNVLDGYAMGMQISSFFEAEFLPLIHEK